MKIHGWGNYSVVDAQILKPAKANEVNKLIQVNKNIIARGLGRSYGDSANSNTVLDTTSLNSVLKFDSESGVILCESGVSIKEINKLTIPQGWFVPVTSGSSYVTLGGAIASDIHGKNHHLDGAFSDHILSAKLILGDGEILTISSTINSDLFQATCGGMGLTGIIISASIKLKPISSNLIKQTTIKNNSLEELFNQFEINFSSPYSVAWLDCSNKSKSINSLLFLGEHLKKGKLIGSTKKQRYIPIKFFSMFLNKHFIKIFNYAYYFKNLKKIKTTQVSLENYFYPLDSLMNWNFLYGKKGFIQYQFVIPKMNGVQILKKILDIINEHDQTPFLAVLKILGPQNNNYLSFPIEGYTLALDFKVSHGLLELISILDKVIALSGGRIYLTKDAIMSKEIFRECYPKWKEFEKIRRKYKAIRKFTSHQSLRLGLE
tara:strand:- start:2311 stop:3609 length:1299 start_codon:yes stop_codon:yes gene_type:complete